MFNGPKTALPPTDAPLIIVPPISAGTISMTPYCVDVFVISLYLIISAYWYNRYRMNIYKVLNSSI